MLTFDPPPPGMGSRRAITVEPSQLRNPEETRELVAGYCMKEYGPGTLSGDIEGGFTFHPDPVEVTK